MKNKGVKLRDILYGTAIALVVLGLIYHLFFEDSHTGKGFILLTLSGGVIGIIACLRDIIIEP